MLYIRLRPQQVKEQMFEKTIVVFTFMVYNRIK